MRNSRRLAGPALPQPIENPKTMKQRLHNDILSLLSEKGLKWRGDEVFNVGLAFLRAIVDSLWIIDGHHDVFASRSIEIPLVFHPFSGYNRPERSKHRKRTLQNLSSAKLRVCSNSLFGCLQGGILGAGRLEKLQN